MDIFFTKLSMDILGYPKNPKVMPGVGFPDVGDHTRPGIMMIVTVTPCTATINCRGRPGLAHRDSSESPSPPWYWPAGGFGTGVTGTVSSLRRGRFKPRYRDRDSRAGPAGGPSETRLS